jgi:hypothetical protein
LTELAAIPTISFQGYSAQWLRVMYCESRLARLTRFGISSAGTPIVPYMLIAESIPKACRHLDLHRFELVVLSDYQDEHYDLPYKVNFVRFLAKKHEMGALGGVILNMMLCEEAWTLKGEMEALHLPSIFIPFNPLDPSDHSRVR